MPSEPRYIGDKWPVMPDGSDWDGLKLLELCTDGKSPFAFQWDVQMLIDEINDALNMLVIAIPKVTCGSNSYGFDVQLATGQSVIVVLSKADVNMPDYDGFTLESRTSDDRFQEAVYTLLKNDSVILPSSLIYSRSAKQNEERTQRPTDISGRSLSIFRKPAGGGITWSTLCSEQKTAMLTQCAEIRAALFNFNVPHDISTTWLRERLFEQRPDTILVPVAPTREFCMALFTSKVEATIRNIGDMIGWPSDNVVVGPLAAAAKVSLLRFIPYMLPPDDPNLYRIVLEHGDFGIHNMTAQGSRITSLFDWETGCLCPAILSNPEVAVKVDLSADEYGKAVYTRVPEDAAPDDLEKFRAWADHYLETLYHEAPDYRRAIKEGKDARHLWFALRDWRGVDPEGYFGRLGAWAECRMRDMELPSEQSGH